MAENWGNDFISAYLNGVKLRLAREDQEFEQNRKTQMLPLEKARLAAETDSAKQHALAMQAQVGAHAEEFKSKLREQFASGLRGMKPAIANPQMPGERTPGIMDAGSQLEQAGANPQLLALLAQHGGIQSSVPMPDNLPQSQIQTPETQGQPYRGLSRPDDTQVVDVDPRLDPRGYMAVDNIVTPEEKNQENFKDLMLKATIAAKQKGLEAQAVQPLKIEQDLKKAEAVGKETRLTEGVRGANAQTLQGIKDTAAEARRKAGDDAAYQRVLASNTGRNAAATITANAHKYAVDNKKPTGTVIDPEEASAAVQSIITGNAEMPALSTPSGRMYNKIMSDSGLVRFPKKDRDKLVSLHDIDGILSYMQQQVKDAPTNLLGAWQNNALSKIKGTDANEAYNIIFGRGALASHVISGEVGRLSDPDIERAMRIIGTTGKKKDQIVAELEKIKSEKSTKIKGILTGQKAHQRIMNMEQAGFDPSAEGGTIKVPGYAKEIPLYVQKDGKWYAFDEKQNGYVEAK